MKSNKRKVTDSDTFSKKSKDSPLGSSDSSSPPLVNTQKSVVEQLEQGQGEDKHGGWEILDKRLVWNIQSFLEGSPKLTLFGQWEDPTAPPSWPTDGLMPWKWGSVLSDSEPTAKTDDVAAFEAMEIKLNERLQNVNIEVKEMWNGRPYEVLLVDGDVTEIYSVEGFESQDELLPPSEQNKYYDVKNEEINRRLELFLHVLSKGFQYLTIDFNSSEFKDLKWKLVAEGEERERTAEGDVRKKGAAGQPSEKEMDLCDKLLCLFLKSMTHMMQNSRGPNFLINLLEACLYVGLSEEDKRKVHVLLVGSSSAVDEGFRVQWNRSNLLGDTKTPGTSHTAYTTTACSSPEDNSRSTTPNSSEEGSDFASDIESTSLRSRKDIATDRNSSDSGRSAGRRSSPHRTGYVFPDVVVTSHKNGFARYLVVVGVKSTDLSRTETSQIYREMIGAGMCQNVIFGVLLNHIEAKIWKMTVDRSKNVVKFSHEVSFCFPQRGMGYFFRHLIAILDYAYANATFQRGFITQSGTS